MKIWMPSAACSMGHVPAGPDHNTVADDPASPTDVVIHPGPAHRGARLGLQ
jgi:hypothetical protein